MARSAALGFALAGVGAVAVISGIQGKSIANVLKGELGTPPNPAFGKGPTVALEGTAQGVTGEAPGELSAVGEGGQALAESGNSPLSPGAIANKTLAGSRKKEELQYNVAQGLKLTEQLNQEVKNHRITVGQATAIFNKAYPHYAKEVEQYTGRPQVNKNPY